MKVEDIIVRVVHEEDFLRFLNLNEFEVEDLGNAVYRVVRGDELPVYLNIGEESIYFELEIGGLKDFDSGEELLFKLLELNAEIQPVSFGLNNTNPDDPRLVLVESRETKALNDNEVLSVFDALELAADKAEKLLSQYIKKKPAA